MTIAIPGETPVAVAQTGMLSVSATAAPGNSFGGPQIIEIIVDDPTRSDLETAFSSPDVTIDGDPVTMTQADTGKWYAYVASASGVAAANIVNGDFPDDGDALADTEFLDAPATAGRDGGTFALQTYPLDDDSDIDVVLGTETITLHYDADLDDLATVSTDRAGVPIGGQVHVTISDFRLNLDPTEADVWYMNASGSSATYGTTPGDPTATPSIDSNALPDTEDAPITDWSALFGGKGGKFTLADPMATISDIDVTGNRMVNDLIPDASDNIVRFEETGANTGVFTSENNDVSNIKATGNENDDFTIAYADSDVQVFIEDFDSTLELIADGTWNSGETATVRLSDENLDFNTLDDENMEIDDELPVLILGEPITLVSLDSTGTYDDNADNAGGDNATATPEVPRGTITVNSNTGVGALAILDTEDNAEVAFTLDLTEGQVNQINSGASYIQYLGPAVTIGGFDAEVTFAATDLDDVALTAAGITDEVDDEGNDVATGATITLTYNNEEDNPDDRTVIFDIFTFGATENHAIYRALLEETEAGAVFEGTIEYKMLNQRTNDKSATHTSAVAIDDELVIILDKDYTGGDAPEFLYDADGPGGDEPANASEDAPTNTGEVSVDAATYRVSDDVTITLVDADLNTDSGAREIYKIANSSGTIPPRLASIAIGDLSCASEIGDVSLRETASDSGVFEGSFTVPSACGVDVDNDPILTTGESITITYVDFRDENGGDSEWTDSATIGADTGSVSLDRTVYPVPPGDEVTITVSVDDADEDTSSSSKQTISGVVLKVAGLIVGLGELKETEPDSGIFEAAVTIGPQVTGINDNTEPPITETVPIEQGDIITVKYTDESDASGNENSVSDSATFDLRNAVLQSDKSVYVIGQDALLTLIEADLNLDSGTIDNVGLDRIAWDSDAYDDSLDTDEARAALGPVPTNLRETGENTGIFQVVITISEKIGSNSLERGEEITLTYIDKGPSGADFVGDDERDVELQIETSNFGATVELDQNVYTWTDKVYITVVASDYNFDSNIVDEIGTDEKGEITIRTRADELQYRLAETGPDTGVFTGELVLTGDADAIDDGPSGRTSDSIAGPTDGTIKTRTADGISISFDYSDSEAPLVASALIRWNVGEVQWLEASYAATGSGVVRIIDPDMNINPDAVDSIDAVVYSETFIGGIELTLTETQEASGIFEGTVEFDPESASDGHRLQVTEGDIVTAAYDDETLPKPDNGDTLEITATTLIGSIVPPLERAPASNPAIVDAFGNSLASVSADQQVQITADLTSGQDRDQDFAYLVQIQNEDGVTIALSWITGTLGAGATFSPSQSWTPSETGSYTATIFVWESVSNPTALSPQLSITIDVV